MAEIDDDAMLDAQAAEHPAEPDGRASLEVYRFRGFAADCTARALRR